MTSPGEMHWVAEKDGEVQSAGDRWVQVPLAKPVRVEAGKEYVTRWVDGVPEIVEAGK